MNPSPPTRAGLNTAAFSSSAVDLTPHLVTAIPYVSAGVTLLLAAFTAAHLLLLPPNIKLIMVPLAATTAVLSGVIFVLARRSSLHEQRAHWIAFFLAMLLLANSATHLWITQNPLQTTFLMMLVIGIASFFVSPAFYLAGVATISVSWFAIAWHRIEHPEWGHFGFVYFTSVVLATLIFFVRLKILQTLETWKLEQQLTYLQLQQSRDTLSVLNEELERRVEARTHELSSAVHELHGEVERRKEAEATLIESEKLAATGRLAAALAHEINNPLSAVANAVYLMRNGNLDPEQAAEQLRIADTELGRVTQIIRQILGFYRESLSPVGTNINHLVDETLTLFAPMLRRANIDVVPEYGSRDRILTFPGEVRQVLANLIANAIDVMPQGGRILIRTKSVQSGVWVFVGDTGPGIKPQVKERMFQPFFSTKGERGTGLGLWVSRSIVQKHHGRLLVKSVQGRGSVFCVYFPDQLEVVATR